MKFNSGTKIYKLGTDKVFTITNVRKDEYYIKEINMYVPSSFIDSRFVIYG